MEIPKNLEECYLFLDGVEDIDKWLKKSEESATSSAHHGMGQWIRNNWGLWSGDSDLCKWFKLNEIDHPDDMSGIILTSFYRYKNNTDIRLEELFDESIEYYLTDQEKLLRKRKKKLIKLNEI
jgi:hypothetical protein